MNQPIVFEYLDTTQYLKDFYKYRKHMVKKFSYEVWATELKIKSRGHLRDIIIGQSNLTEALIPLFIKSLKLDTSAAEYFTLLTRYSTAQSAETKMIYGKSLFSYWKIKLHQIEISDIEEFLSDSIIPVVFTYLSFEDVSSDLNEMVKALGYSLERIQRALKCLIWQKLVDGELSDEGFIKYKTVQPFFKIHSTPDNIHLRNFHIEGLKLAEKAHYLPAEHRKFFSYFVALNPEQFIEAQKIVQDSNDKILALFDSSQLSDRVIFRLNSQIFPVSKFKEEQQLETSGDEAVATG